MPGSCGIWLKLTTAVHCSWPLNVPAVSFLSVTIMQCTVNLQYNSKIYSSTVSSVVRFLYNLSHTAVQKNNMPVINSVWLSLTVTHRLRAYFRTVKNKMVTLPTSKVFGIHDFADNCPRVIQTAELNVAFVKQLTTWWTSHSVSTRTPWRRPVWRRLAPQTTIR